jgi:uncharacterized protein (TIGR01777 family)
MIWEAKSSWEQAMEILVTGGTGFVGSEVVRGLLAQHHRVTVLSRSADSRTKVPENANFSLVDPSQPGPWQDQLGNYQVIVNLAGASIFARWNPQHKEIMLTSRVQTTKNLVDALSNRDYQEPPLLINASAVGYYGFRQDEDLDESAEPGDDFLARLCRNWEAEAVKAESAGIRVIRARFGIVLGLGGGALGQMLPLFRRGLGGPLGSGGQWFSWIHMADLVDAIIFFISRPNLSGAFNLTAPQPVTNKELARALGKALGMPSFLPAPGFMIKAVMGEFGDVLLKGQKVLPKNLLQAGFKFQYAGLEEALDDLLAK